MLINKCHYIQDHIWIIRLQVNSATCLKTGVDEVLYTNINNMRREINNKLPDSSARDLRELL